MTEFQYLNQGNSEAQDRLATSFLLQQTPTPGLATTGVFAGLAVAQTATASTAVTISSGAGNSQDTVGNGAAFLINDTVKTLDILTANPVGGTPRNDIVVFDSATTSIRALIGIPNASPTDPTIPATAIPLARIRNAGGATSIPSTAIDDLRTYTNLFNQPIPVPNLTARNALTPVNGTRAMRMDLGGRVETYNAADSAWYPRSGTNIAGAGWADNTGTPFNGTSYRRTADGLCQMSGLLYRTDPTFSTTNGVFYVIGFVPAWMAPTDCAKQFDVWSSLGPGAVVRVTTAGQVSFASIGSSFNVVSGTFSVSVEGSWWR
jgi:hypothetical protein